LHGDSHINEGQILHKKGWFYKAKKHPINTIINNRIFKLKQKYFPTHSTNEFLNFAILKNRWAGGEASSANHGWVGALLIK